MPDTQSPPMSPPASKTPTPSLSTTNAEQRSSPRISTSPPLVPVSNITQIDSEQSQRESPAPQPEQQQKPQQPQPQNPQQSSPSQQATASVSSDGSGDKNSTNPQQFCLRWNNYQSNLTNVFDQLLHNESFVDVTLACDGNSIKAHKMVLSACSPYFQGLFLDNPCQHPIVIMRDVKWPELTAIVEFMYKGEINVRQEQIAPLLRVAEMLKIRGLADVKNDQEVNTNNSTEPAITPEITPVIKKPRITARTEWQINNLDLSSKQHQLSNNRHHRKKRWPSVESNRTNSPVHTPSKSDMVTAPSPQPSTPTPSVSHLPAAPSTPPSIPQFPIPSAATLDAMALSSLAMAPNDDMEIKPGIAEMIREEERVSDHLSLAYLIQTNQQWIIFLYFKTKNTIE